MSFERDRFYSHDTHQEIPIELGKLPSVTTITNCYPKPWMMGWIKKEGSVEAAEVKKEKATTAGQRTHELINQLIRTNQVDLSLESDEVKQTIQAFQTWCDHTTFEPIDSEQVIWSAKYGYAGRLDAVGWVNGNLSLIDFKTSNSLYPEHEIQAAAYAVAYEEWKPRLFGAEDEPLINLLIVKLGKDHPTFEISDVTKKLAQAFECFLALKTIWEYPHKFSSTMSISRV